MRKQTLIIAAIVVAIFGASGWLFTNKSTKQTTPANSSSIVHTVDIV